MTILWSYPNKTGTYLMKLQRSCQHCNNPIHPNSQVRIDKTGWVWTSLDRYFFTIQALVTACGRYCKVNFTTALNSVPVAWCPGRAAAGGPACPTRGSSCTVARPPRGRRCRCSPRRWRSSGGPVSSWRRCASPLGSPRYYMCGNVLVKSNLAHLTPLVLNRRPYWLF